MQERKLQFALFVVRVTLGFVFFMHGMQKVFGAFGGPGLNGFAQYMAALTTVMPKFTAYAVAFGELLAGTALLFGCFHRLAAFSIILIMAGAIYLVTQHNGFFIEGRGYEYNLTLIALAVAVLMGGPGAWAYRVELKKNQRR